MTPTPTIAATAALAGPQRRLDVRIRLPHVFDDIDKFNIRPRICANATGE
ncbi:hypothetical protein Pd630_LPD05296 [Rhodococcus opacus PD630]|nr:hypothetical protein Pd630_LPD05296 [Rhodococcus opacus PD630]